MVRLGKAGFTLLELLIVVVIIGILATIAAPRFTRALEAARQGEARHILGAIWQAEKLYYSEKDKYTDASPTTNPLLVDIPATASTDHYFTYSVSASTTTFVATATRKISTDTGRSPFWTTNYTVKVDEKGDFTVTGF